MKSVITVLAEGFEELEAIAPIDLLRRAGARVDIVGLESAEAVTSKNGIVVQPDAALADKSDEEYDLVFIPGGPSHLAMMESKPLLTFIKKADGAGKQISAICAGPKVLQAAGVLTHQKHTCHFTAYKALPHADRENPVVVDGRLTTSQGAGTATLFGLQLVENLFGPEKRKEVADSICAVS